MQRWGFEPYWKTNVLKTGSWEEKDRLRVNLTEGIFYQSVKNVQQKLWALEYLVDFCENICLSLVVVIQFNFQTSMTTLFHISVLNSLSHV